MKKAYRANLQLGRANITKLHTVNKIISEYAAQGYNLTLRQLYYQLVSRDIIPNKDAEYSKLSTLLVKGRMAGVVDWNAIEDRIRVPNIPYWVKDIPDALQDTIDAYRLDRQKGQEVYIEVWVEKDALSNVLKRITHHYHIKLMVNRGYSSCTAMHDAYKRIDRALLDVDRTEAVILYLGDHDPSGRDMVRDIRERLEEFGLDDMQLTVKHIALTKDQIDEYDPPPNPAKLTDPRSRWYLDKHGDTSWEVDALPPDTLHEIIGKEVEELIDMSLFNSMIKLEEKHKKELQTFVSKHNKKGRKK